MSLLDAPNAPVSQLTQPYFPEFKEATEAQSVDLFDTAEETGEEASPTTNNIMENTSRKWKQQSVSPLYQLREIIHHHQKQHRTFSRRQQHKQQSSVTCNYPE